MRAICVFVLFASFTQTNIFVIIFSVTFNLKFSNLFFGSKRDLRSDMFQALICSHFKCWMPFPSMSHITVLKLVITQIFKLYELIFKRCSISTWWALIFDTKIKTIPIPLCININDLIKFLFIRNRQ